MKIAFISYEYPPDSAYGGIGTYVFQAVRMLIARGHHVEVFSSSPTRSSSTTEENIMVHRVIETNYESFSAKIGYVFAHRHSSIQFDVLEGPEYGGDALEAIKLVPDIPLVIKLHTPTFLTVEGTYRGLPYVNSLRLKILAGKVKKYVNESIKGNRPLWRHTYKYQLEKERLVTLQADEIVAPSRSIRDIVTQAWKLDPVKLAHVPYPFVPSQELLEIPIETESNVVTFLGRLEVRKGVLDLARAIPLVLHKHPQAVFRFVGSTEHSHRRNIDMRDYLQNALLKYKRSVEFIDQVPPQRVPRILAETDICVFPSIWENFANVCLESMAAGRGVIASEAGGMAEMLDFGRFGQIIPPRSYRKIAQAIIQLLDNTKLRMRLGRAARDRLLIEYSIERVSRLHEASYRRAIARRREQGSRAV